MNSIIRRFQPPNVSLGWGGNDFSRKIIDKYEIARKYKKIPFLVFIHRSGLRDLNRNMKLSNLSIKNNLNLFFKLIRHLIEMKTSGYLNFFRNLLLYPERISFDSLSISGQDKHPALSSTQGKGTCLSDLRKTMDIIFLDTYSYKYAQVKDNSEYRILSQQEINCERNFICIENDLKKLLERDRQVCSKIISNILQNTKKRLASKISHEVIHGQRAIEKKIHLIVYHSGSNLTEIISNQYNSANYEKNICAISSLSSNPLSLNFINPVNEKGISRSYSFNFHPIHGTQLINELQPTRSSKIANVISMYRHSINKRMEYMNPVYEVIHSYRAIEKKIPVTIYHSGSNLAEMISNQYNSANYGKNIYTISFSYPIHGTQLINELQSSRSSKIANMISMYRHSINKRMEYMNPVYEVIHGHRAIEKKIPVTIYHSGSNLAEMISNQYNSANYEKNIYAISFLSSNPVSLNFINPVNETGISKSYSFNFHPIHGTQLINELHPSRSSKIAHTMNKRKEFMNPVHEVIHSHRAIEKKIPVTIYHSGPNLVEMTSNQSNSANYGKNFCAISLLPSNPVSLNFIYPYGAKDISKSYSFNFHHSQSSKAVQSKVNSIHTFNNEKKIQRHLKTSEKMVYPKNHSYFDDIENGSGISMDFNLSNDRNMTEPAELILRKPLIKKADEFSENSEKVHKGSEMTGTKSYDLIKESFNDIEDINTIADRVYKILEKRISIEKDRRGLF